MSVRLERRGSTAWLIIDRPEARNALSFAMFDQIRAFAEQLASDADVRAVVIAGGPEAFAAGADIAEFRAFAGPDAGRAYEAKVEGVLRAIEALPVPTVAALAGACTGGGVFLASACDLRIAAANLRVGVPIARTLGNVTTLANVRRLSALIGPGRVKEWFMTARLCSAEKASHLGFVSEVVETPSALEARAQALAGELAGFAPLTLRATKDLYRHLVHGGEIDERAIFASCYNSEDFREGVDAFFAKRRPNWRGV
jgi:enoyl-CoA hydratase